MIFACIYAIRFYSYTDTQSLGDFHGLLNVFEDNRAYFALVYRCCYGICHLLIYFEKSEQVSVRFLCVVYSKITIRHKEQFIDKTWLLIIFISVRYQTHSRHHEGEVNDRQIVFFFWLPVQAFISVYFPFHLKGRGFMRSEVRPETSHHPRRVVSRLTAQQLFMPQVTHFCLNFISGLRNDEKEKKTQKLRREGQLCLLRMVLRPLASEEQAQWKSLGRVYPNTHESTALNTFDIFDALPVFYQQHHLAVEPFLITAAHMRNLIWATWTMLLRDKKRYKMILMSSSSHPKNLQIIIFLMLVKGGQCKSRTCLLEDV